jgi:hypothetical protein
MLSSAAAFLDGLFEHPVGHPAGYSGTISVHNIATGITQKPRFPPAY